MDPLYVKSKIKEYVKKSKYKDFRVAGATWAAINKYIAAGIDRGLERCKENKRKTLWPADF
ncbi:MAG: hypothetical protein ACW976_05095 [Candidatus Ranarchaeia archaeon]|jgi:hypothetical protein